MPYYKRGGTSHEILTRLAIGPTTFAGLARAIGCEEPGDYSRLKRKIDRLLEYGAIESDHPAFIITDHGLEKLAILDRTHTSVRVFERRAA